MDKSTLKVLIGLLAALFVLIATTFAIMNSSDIKEEQQVNSIYK